jgi:hypothetical protein
VYARSVADAFALARRDELAASVYNLLHGHHQRVSAASCKRTTVMTCSVWVMPIREQLSIAIACRQHGVGKAASVSCTTDALDLLPVQAMSTALPGVRDVVASHGYSLANAVCDDPWEEPRQISDPDGLTRSYHCMLWLSAPGAPTVRSRAELTINLAKSAGGWQLSVLDNPSIHGRGRTAAPAGAAA